MKRVDCARIAYYSGNVRLNERRSNQCGDVNGEGSAGGEVQSGGTRVGFCAWCDNRERSEGCVSS